MQQEGNLVRRAQKGEPEAFEELYEAHFNKIYRYIMLRVRNQEEAEDLTQQVFLKSWESIGSYKWKGVPFSSWLFRIAHNQVVDHQRKMNKERSLPLEEAETKSGDDPVKQTEQKMKLEQLAKACEQLTDAQQEVISLRFAGGLSVAETAKAVNRSEGAVKVMQHDALVKLRKILPTISGEVNV